MDHEVERSLVAALIAGVSETPLWSTFLNLLKSTTGADAVTMTFTPPGRFWTEAVCLVADGLDAAAVEELTRARVLDANAPRDPMLQEGRPYSLEELLDASNAPDDAYTREAMEQFALAAVRHMRVREASGIDAWLTLSRSTGDFSDEVAELMSAVAPALRGVLQLHVAMERERYAASLSADAVRRLQFGWIALDPAGKVLDCDEQASIMLADSGVIKRSSSGKLAASPLELEKEIYAALASVAASGKSRPRAITLCREPWLDMLLVPANRKSIAPGRAPAAIAYVHGDNWQSADRCDQLAELFGLAPREAKLALALSRGMSIAEAATEFGLTEGSARVYSRQIYAKTGARGLPDLVRIVLRSVLAFSPEL